MKTLGSWLGLWLGLGLVALAQSAGAQPRVTQQIKAPYAPPGYVIERTADCRIESSGRAPDARLRCAPGLGWRLRDATGAVVYPKAGYLRDDAAWAFAGSGVIVFRNMGELTRVELPSGASTRLGRGNLVMLAGVEGLGFEALVWLADEMARPLLADGALGSEITGAHMLEATPWLGDTCASAVALLTIGAERLPNAVWTEIRRAEVGAGSVCDRAMSSRMAGRGPDGKWRALDPSTLKAKGRNEFATAEEALAWE